MATITLEYDARNKTAKTILETIEKSGAFKFVRKEKTVSGREKTLQAIEEIRNGGGIYCENFDDFLRKLEE